MVQHWSPGVRRAELAVVCGAPPLRTVRCTIRHIPSRHLLRQDGSTSTLHQSSSSLSRPRCTSNHCSLPSLPQFRIDIVSVYSRRSREVEDCVRALHLGQAAGVVVIVVGCHQPQLLGAAGPALEAAAHLATLQHMHTSVTRKGAQTREGYGVVRFYACGKSHSKKDGKKGGGGSHIWRHAWSSGGGC